MTSLFAKWNDIKQSDTVRINALSKITDNYLYSVPDSAILMAQKGYQFAKSKKLLPAEAKFLNEIGIAYSIMGDHPKSLEYYQKTLQCVEKLGNKHSVAVILANIGVIYFYQRDFEKALVYQNRSLNIGKEINDTAIQAKAYNNIGIVYQDKKEFQNALHYYQKSLEIDLASQNKEGIATSYNNIGQINAYLNNYNMAFEYYKKSLNLFIELEDKNQQAGSLINIGLLNIQTNNLKEAEINCEKGLAIAKEINVLLEKRDACNCLYEINKENGQLKKAFEYYLQYIIVRDSIINDERSKEIMKKEFQYDYEKKAAADSIKHGEEKKVKDAQLLAQTASLNKEKIQRYSLYGGLLLVSGFLIFMFNRFRITQKQKKIIELQKLHVDEAYEKLHEKNKEVMDSIFYARRIQRALVTSEKYIERSLNRLRKSG